MRGRVDVRIGTGEKGRSKEREPILRDDSSGEEEHRPNRQRTQNRDEEVQDRRNIDSPEIGEARLDEEHPGKVRIRDAPPVIRGRDVPRAHERPEYREVLARVRAPVHKGPERGEPDRDRAERNRGQPEGDGLPHLLANRAPLLKGIRTLCFGSKNCRRKLFLRGASLYNDGPPVPRVLRRVTG